MVYIEKHFASIDSTNKYLKEHHNDIDNFYIVSTDYQTQGRGRNDRIWYANKGENLMFSILIKEQEYIKLGGYLSLITAYTIASILESKYSVTNVSIKWPNDVYIGEQKVCGILLEGEVPNYIVIGVGLNVNQVEFNDHYRISPTSIKLILNKDININILKEDIYVALIDNIVHSYKNKYNEYFRQQNYLKSKHISFISNNMKLSGEVIDIDDDFALKIKVNDKEIIINSGEINYES